MLGDCEITGEEFIPAKMTKQTDDSLPSNRSLTSPPPAKKLKQARLPFKILDQKPPEVKPVITPTPTKKRKSSDGAPVPQKGPKIQKSDENGRGRKISRHDDAENEVSSSSEAENLSKISNYASRCDKPRGLERFVQSTQQLEVSTSSEVVDLTLDDSNPSEKEKVSVGNDEVTDCSKEAKTADDESAVKPDNEAGKELQKEGGVMKYTDAFAHRSEALGSDLNDSTMSNPLDTTDVSTRTNTSDDTSDKDSIADESESDKANEKSRPSTPSTPCTPSQARPRRTSLSSAKKSANARESKMQEREKIKAERLLEKELKRKKREEERKEKERQKEELRLEKEKQRQEEKERKEAEKNKKEKERLEKLAEKEREKIEKSKQKEEEKKKKQEALDAKAEEKRKRDEEKEAERKRKEDEKLKQEEGKARKIQQTQAMFKSFFKKVEKTETSPAVTEDVGSFAAFQVLENMKMAPIHRVPKETLPSTCVELDTLMSDQLCDILYLTTLKNGATKPRRSAKTWPADDDVLIEDPATPSKPPAKAKLYQFHENYRPAYFGTWRKRSKTISPRNPFKKDEVYLDYEVDSDDEWEEEEPGESLSNSEDEGEEQTVEADEDDEDGFFVPHGYLSDGEGCEDDDEEDRSPESLKMRQMVKAKNFEAELKKTTEILKMLVVGCCWLQTDGTCDPQLDPYKAQIISEETPILIDVEPSSEGKSTKTSKEKRGMKPQGVPDEAMPHLIRLIHGNVYSHKKMLKEFIIYWKRRETKENPDTSASDTGNEIDSDNKVPENSPSETPDGKEAAEETTCCISRRQLDLKIRSIAAYERRNDHRLKCWYVKDEVLEQYGLKDLPVPTDWNWITHPGKLRNTEEGTASSPAAGKETQAPSTNQGSIKQFAVPGLVHSNAPLPSVQASPSPAVTNQNPPSKKTPKRITPITLFCAKKTEPAVKEKRCLLEPQKDSPMEVSCKSSEVVDGGDNDCMIIDEPFAPPAPSKSQPTIVNMFGQKGAKKQNI